MLVISCFSFLLLAQKKQNKEKGSLSNEFFDNGVEKHCPKLCVAALLISEPSATILGIRVLAALAINALLTRAE